MKTKPRLPDDAILLAHLGQKNIPALVRWLDANRLPTENIDVHQWQNELWYVVVVDATVAEKYPADIVIGFTVDLENDSIFWSAVNKHLPFSGNCFCRSGRWWRLLRKQYSEANENTVYDYRLPRKAKVSVK